MPPIKKLVWKERVVLILYATLREVSKSGPGNHTSKVSQREASSQQGTRKACPYHDTVLLPLLVAGLAAIITPFFDGK
jgi:hypothetical protein